MCTLKIYVQLSVDVWFVSKVSFANKLRERVLIDIFMFFYFYQQYRILRKLIAMCNVISQMCVYTQYMVYFTRYTLLIVPIIDWNVAIFGRNNILMSRLLRNPSRFAFPVDA